MFSISNKLKCLFIRREVNLYKYLVFFYKIFLVQIINIGECVSKSSHFALIEIEKMDSNVLEKEKKRAQAFFIMLCRRILIGGFVRSLFPKPWEYLCVCVCVYNTC